jgi:hypothetical protein
MIQNKLDKSQNTILKLALFNKFFVLLFSQWS